MTAQASRGKRALRAVNRRVSAALPPAQRRQWLYLRVHRRWLSLDDPTDFTEKVNWRILYDRRDALAWTCDKIQMKEHARESGAAVVVPETYWTGTDVAELASEHLPDRWVLKPSHRSGLVYFGDRDTSFPQLAELTRDWLSDVQTDTYAEWAYSQATRRLFVEELIGNPGSPPTDYKFFVFDGEPRLVQVDVDRFSGHRRALYTPDWQKVDAELNHPDPGPLPAPDNLHEMVAAAGTLAKGWDFMRVDLYSHEGKVVFGEYSPYPSSGLERFKPRTLDARLGALWTLPVGDDT